MRREGSPGKPCPRTVRTHTRSPIPLVVLALLVLFATVPASGAEAGGFLWVADHHALVRIDTESNQAEPLGSLSHKPEALAIAGNSTWVLLKKELIRYDNTGKAVEEIDLSVLGVEAGEGGRLAIDPYDDSVWVAAGKLLSHVVGGKRGLQWQAPERILDIALDPDESLWVLTQKQLLLIDGNGVVRESVDLHPAIKDPAFLAVDGLGGIVWIAGHKHLYVLDTNKLDIGPQPVPVSGHEQFEGDVRSIAVHPVFGTLWLLTKGRLWLYDRAGAPIRMVDLTPSGIDEARVIVFEPISLSLWIGGKRMLGRFTGNGEFVALVGVEKKIEALGVPPFTLAPTLRLVRPENGTTTADPRPTLELEIGAACNDVPCLPVDAYLSSLAMEAWLNGIDISDRFVLSGAMARYTPDERLPEGENDLTARVNDVFGHSSQWTSTLFTIDTIPPKFLSVLPPDGSTLTNAQAVISGQVDDQTANVLLLASDGGLLSMGGANFVFAVTVQPGENRFTLTAQDPAGNSTSQLLRLTYRTSTVAVTNVKNGDRIEGGSVFLIGTFQGPPNTGVIVDGKVAYTQGNQFFVEVDLSPGENQIAITASTEDGLLGQETITLYRDAAVYDVERAPSQAPAIHTVAGNGIAGFGADGQPATQSSLFYPSAIAIGASGELYIADYTRVRRVTTDGVITTYAGVQTPPSGSEPEPGRNLCTEGNGGLATEVEFAFITDLAMDPARTTLYVVDYTAGCVRRVDPDGRIYTVAGGGQSTDAGDGGPATEATLVFPLSVAVGPDGSLYIAEDDYPRIRRVTPDGTITTIAGNRTYDYSGDGGLATEASFTSIWDLAFDSKGSLYIADSNNRRIRRIDLDGIVTTFAGSGSPGYSGDGGPAVEAQFDFPSGLAFGPDGALYVADTDNSVIRRIAPDETITTIAGTGEYGYDGDGGPPRLARFAFPMGLAIDAGGSALVADSDNQRIRSFPVISENSEFAPVRVRFSISGDSGIQRIEADFDGDGKTDFATTNPNVGIASLYEEPGVYQATFTVTDSTGNKHVRTVPVLIKDIEEQDELLRSIYASMLNRLGVRDIDGALKTISGAAREKYRAVFDVLAPDLPTIVDQLGTLKEGAIGEEIAEYVLVRDVNGKSVAFLIYFLRGEDGVWRIEGM